MSKNFWIACLAANVVALGVLVARQSHQIAVLKAEHAAERAALKEKAAARVKRISQAERPADEPVEAAPLRAAAAQAEPEAPAAQAAAPHAAAGSNFMGAVAGLMKNPQMKEMIKAQQKVAVAQMYGGLSRYLSLAPEVKERLDALLLERQVALTDAGLAMMSGSQEERQRAAEETKAITQEYDQALKELLGDADYEVYKQYEQSIPEQTHVSMFKNALAGDEPLTEQQEYDLVSAMFQARKELPADSLLSRREASADPAQFSEERINETLRQMEELQKRYAESAQGVLSEAQLARFKQWQQQMATMQQAGLKMAAQMFGQGKAGAGAAQK